MALPIAGPVVRPALDSLRRSAPGERGYWRQAIGSGPRPVVRTDPAAVSTRRTAKPAAGKRAPRKRTSLYASTASFLILTLAVAIGATAESPSLMSQQDYAGARRGLQAEWRLELAQCRAREGGEKDRCRAAARGADRVRKAELEARYRGTVGAGAGVEQARVRMRYEVAKAGCLASPDERASCLAAARAGRARALADARPSTT